MNTTDGSNLSFAGISTAPNVMTPANARQFSQALQGALARFIADGGGTVTTGGSANAQTVTLNQAIATTVPTGFFFTVKFGYTNTSTTVTLNVNSIGAKSVKVNFGGVLSDPIPGDMRAGAYGHFIYDGTYMVLLNAQQQARYAPGTLYGLTLSNNSSDPTNDIDIAVGSARDGADSANMDLATALTKQLDAAWAVGTNAGGRFDASISDVWWHAYLIKRPDTGVVDVGFSTNATNPTGGANYPAAYTIYRRIASFGRTSGVIQGQTQYGDIFIRTSIGQDVSASNPGTSAVTRTLGVPTGFPVQAIIDVRLIQADSAITPSCLITSLVQTDVAPGTSTGAFTIGSTANASGYAQDNVTTINVMTNSSAQIRSRLSASNANTTLQIGSLGWIDGRGRT